MPWMVWDIERCILGADGQRFFAQYNSLPKKLRALSSQVSPSGGAWHVP